MATADSRVRRAIWTPIRANRRLGPTLAVWFPSSVINRWPAIIFADKRTAKVPGRITFLMVSISTMNGIRAPGVPWGIKWENIWLVLMIHPWSINLNHRGRDKESLILRCLEEVKRYGKSPKKLFIRIKPKIVTNRNWVLLIFVLLRRDLNSLEIDISIVFSLHKRRLFFKNKGEEIIKRNIKDLIQFKEVLKEVEGSNTENRFLIIFNFFVWKILLRWRLM